MMKCTSRSYLQGDYKKYIQKLTKQNMQEFFVKNFGGWSDEVSEKKFFSVMENGFVRLFFLDDTFIGYVACETEKNDENSYLVHDIHIKKEFQQKGYGGLMLDFVVKDANAAGKTQLKVFVFENNPALQFYNKHGFKKVEYLQKSRTWVMVRKL